MANATATLSANPNTGNLSPAGHDNSQTRYTLFGTCTLLVSGTYITNGIPLVWNPLVSAAGATAVLPLGPLQTQPQQASFYTKASGLYDYWFDQVHNTLRIKLAGAELTNGAAITADTIGFTASFLRGE